MSGQAPRGQKQEDWGHKGSFVSGESLLNGGATTSATVETRRQQAQSGGRVGVPQQVEIFSPPLHATTYG